MSPAEPFPLFFPSDARRPFESEDVFRRYGRTANLDEGSRVLELAAGRGTAGVAFATELGCNVIAAEHDDKALAALSERAKAAGVADRVQGRKLDYQQLPFSDGEFDAVVIAGRVLMPVSQAAKSLRRLLAPRGRLILTYPVKVGRFPGKAQLEFWEKRLGEALFSPRELLQSLEKSGFEPEGVETLSDPELADLYKGIEPRLGSGPESAALREEIELFRSVAGKTGASYALAIGRRKEPGEKPPASRDRG